MKNIIQLPNVQRLNSGVIEFHAIINGKEVRAEISPQGLQYLLESVGKLVAPKRADCV